MGGVRLAALKVSRLPSRLWASSGVLAWASWSASWAICSSARKGLGVSVLAVGAPVAALGTAVPLGGRCCCAPVGGVAGTGCAAAGIGGGGVVLETTGAACATAHSAVAVQTLTPSTKAPHIA